MILIFRPVWEPAVYMVLSRFCLLLPEVQSFGDQVLVLCCKKEFKGKTNSKQENTRFMKVKVYTQEGNVGELDAVSFSSLSRRGCCPTFFLIWCCQNRHGITYLMKAKVFVM